ncbi:MAG: hypothetical protein C4555_07705 [Dehalococcoidia bacterium]|jgi:peptide/nickel transport system substrate-binding protein|nr:MAG: hypothetical protein C4555_07705 [Dehalococcoidia bacterium]
MKKWTILINMILTLLVLLACSQTASEPTTYQEQASPQEVIKGNVVLHPNPVEESMPSYGGIIKYGYSIPRSFDAHQRVGYGPQAALPVFNQLVMFDINYKDTVLDTVIGDLADRWEWNQDHTELTFHLHQGIKWHDGMPFTADDVVYSLDKMTDFTRSAISDLFPAYQSSEKIDDYTVKIHLKYPSASFIMNLAEGESVIQPKHLAGTNDQSSEFMIGTGPFILEKLIPRVALIYKRNPNYWKKDKYGNQLPYLDGLECYSLDSAAVNPNIISRRLDMKGPVTGSASTSSYDELSQGAPELLWQKRDKDVGCAMFLNLNHEPLNDLRVRKAMSLLINEEELIIGFSGDAKFGIPDIGFLQPSFGLPKEDIIHLMGWDKPWDERVTEAQRLMAEAGYSDGFKLNMLSRGGTQTQIGVNLVFAETLRKYLKIDSEVNGLANTEVATRLTNGNYDLYTQNLRVGTDPSQLAIYFKTGGAGNYSNYSNPTIDAMLEELDKIIDPEERRESIWDIERILLTDLPALPTGCFTANYMPYYPYVKNLRWNELSYSNICRFEDIWIDRDIYQQVHGKLPPSTITTPTALPTPNETPGPTETLAPTQAPAPTETPTPNETPAQNVGDPYDNPDFPVIWVSVDPPEGVGRDSTTVTITLKVPPGALCSLHFFNPVTGTDSSRRPADVVANADGNAVLGPWEIHGAAQAGEATLQLTVTKIDGTQIVVTRPYILK